MKKPSGGERDSGENDNLKILNTSGFPFQLRVAAEIASVTGTLGWKVRASEHYWELDGASGFIDIIAGCAAMRLVIECKRAADSEWLFIEPSGATDEGRVRCLVTDQRPEEDDVSIWADIGVRPPSPEVSFCVVRGQADKEPMLERIAAPLVESVEALANEELALSRPSRFADNAIYVPMLVTAASLKVARFDPVAVSLESGKLADSDVEFRAVPVVRFRKQFGRGEAKGRSRSLEDAQRDNERSVLIVHAAAVQSVLRNWSMFPLDFGGWPHLAAREAHRRALKAT